MTSLASAGDTYWGETPSWRVLCPRGTVWGPLHCWGALMAGGSAPVSSPLAADIASLLLVSLASLLKYKLTSQNFLL